MARRRTSGISKTNRLDEPSDENREPELVVLRRIRSSALRRLDGGNERARVMVEAVEELIEEYEVEPEAAFASKEDPRP